MLNLPPTTAYGKRIPKRKFYDNMSVPPALKRVFVEQISSIVWSNKLSPDTVNIAAGEAVKEIEVFTISLTKSALDVRVLQLIDRNVPYHILFILEYEGMAQAWIGYKEPNLAAADSFKVNRYFHTEWTPPALLALSVEGLTTDDVYDNLLRRIAPEEFGAWSEQIGIKGAVERLERKQQLEKQIAALERKIANEKQFNRQVEMNAELKGLRVELEELL